MDNRLQTLTKIPAISGYENKIVKHLKSLYEGKVFRNDHLGSLIVLNNEDLSNVDVLINSHIDEAGYVVTTITKGGLLKLQAIGSNNSPKTGSLLTVYYNDLELEGIVIEDGGQSFLQLGLVSNEGYEDIIGSMVTYTHNYKRFGNLIYSKALDNRVGTAINAKITNNNYSELNIASSFTTLSYLNSRGARTASYVVNPKLVINLDLININDISLLKLNEGPVLVILDQGVILNNEVKKLFTNFASKNKFKLQMLASNSVKFDTSTISLVQTGIHTVTIGIPARFNEDGQLVSIDDINHTYDLLHRFLNNLSRKELDNLYNY